MNSFVKQASHQPIRLDYVRTASLLVVDSEREGEAAVERRRGSWLFMAFLV